MRDVEIVGKDKTIFGWVICVQKDDVVHRFLGKNLVLFESVANAVVYETKSEALFNLPKSRGRSLSILSSAGDDLLEELDVPIKDLLELFQVKELRVVI